VLLGSEFESQVPMRNHNGWPAVGLQPCFSPVTTLLSPAGKSESTNFNSVPSSFYCATAVLAVAFTRSAVQFSNVQQAEERTNRVRRREATTSFSSFSFKFFKAHHQSTWFDLRRNDKHGKH
jgi:hypothetical protein